MHNKLIRIYADASMQGYAFAIAADSWAHRSTSTVLPEWCDCSNKAELYALLCAIKKVSLFGETAKKMMVYTDSMGAKQLLESYIAHKNVPEWVVRMIAEVELNDGIPANLIFVRHISINGENYKERVNQYYIKWCDLRSRPVKPVKPKKAPELNGPSLNKA